MKKSELISCKLAGYMSNIKPETLKELKKKTSEFEAKNNEIEFSEFATKFDSEFPELKALNEYLIRSKLTSIESHLRTIKTIIVLIFVLSIIGAIIMALYFSTY